jgi:enoyl-CoA hydratase/carnithine racemase
MTSQTLSPPELNTMTIEIDGEIGTLTLNRPDAFNAMSPEMIGEFTVAFGWLADRAPLRALIVTGAGKAFCAGGDVTWFQKGVEAEEIDLPSEVRRGAEALHAAIVDLRRIPYPVIAAVNGPAAGAGFSLALACDTRIASA